MHMHMHMHMLSYMHPSKVTQMIFAALED